MKRLIGLLCIATMLGCVVMSRSTADLLLERIYEQQTRIANQRTRLAYALGERDALRRALRAMSGSEPCPSLPLHEGVAPGQTPVMPWDEEPSTPLSREPFDAGSSSVIGSSAFDYRASRFP